MGVDVFGRGCLGGGGFDTKVAVIKYSNDMFLNLISTLLKGGISSGLWIVSGSLCPRLDLGVRGQARQRLRRPRNKVLDSPPALACDPRGQCHLCGCGRGCARAGQEVRTLRIPLVFWPRTRTRRGPASPEIQPATLVQLENDGIPTKLLLIGGRRGECGGEQDQAEAAPGRLRHLVHQRLHHLAHPPCSHEPEREHQSVGHHARQKEGRGEPG